MTDTPARRIESILFVCSLNSVRSPIAQGLAREMFGRRVYIESAGLRKAQRDPFALAVLREVGFEFSDDQPKTLDEIGFDGFDLIITLSQEAKVVVAERARAVAAELLHWSIDDPTLGEGSREARLQAYRVVRERIRAMLKEQIAPRIRKAV